MIVNLRAGYKFVEEDGTEISWDVLLAQCVTVLNLVRDSYKEVQRCRC